MPRALLANVLIHLLAVSIVAAPVPKGLKRASEEDGLWQVVECNGDDCKMTGKGTVGLYWRIDGGRMSNGKATTTELAAEGCPHTLVRTDPVRPQVRELKLGQGGCRSSVVEVDGDTLRWAWATDAAKTITECKPANGVYFYEFKRVRDEN